MWLLRSTTGGYIFTGVSLSVQEGGTPSPSQNISIPEYFHWSHVLSGGYPDWSQVPSWRGYPNPRSQTGMVPQSQVPDKGVPQSYTGTPSLGLGYRSSLRPELRSGWTNPRVMGPPDPWVWVTQPSAGYDSYFLVRVDWVFSCFVHSASSHYPIN